MNFIRLTGNRWVFVAPLILNQPIPAALPKPACGRPPASDRLAPESIIHVINLDLPWTNLSSQEAPSYGTRYCNLAVTAS